MMIANDKSKNYSLWLIPEKHDYNYLVDIIDWLSVKYHSILFEPHCTLLSGISSEHDILDKIVQVADAFNTKITLQSLTVDHSEVLKKSVFVTVLKSPELAQLHRSALQLFSVKYEGNYDPHISLIYKTIPVEEKLRIINSINIKDSFCMDKLALVESGERFGDWKNVYIHEF